MRNVRQRALDGVDYPLFANLADGDDAPLDRTIDVHIRNLRRKLDADADPTRFIETVIGVGYRLARPNGEGSR